MSKKVSAIPVLMYHQVGEPAQPGTNFRSLTVHPDSFSSQMKWMKRLGYRGLSMRDLLPFLTGDKTGKVFGITFDDGYQNVFKNALPILVKLGFTSTNYFVANQFSGSNVWDRHKNVPPSALMSRDEIIQWARSGQEVGSHTLDHVHLPEVDRQEAFRQISESKTILEGLIDSTVTAFCYPYGDYLPEHAEMARAVGYTNATTTERGLVRGSDNFFELNRVGIWRNTFLLRFFQKC
jgi:peptidoglycan/xylan/chitin deacetylase (PgdA/CDA1 family)